MVIAGRNASGLVGFVLGDLCSAFGDGVFDVVVSNPPYVPEGDRAEFLGSLGLEDSGLDRIIRAGYALLGLITYFTVGPKEARAWTITKGTLAPQAAGVIHGDFEKGFIRAETVGYDDYIAGNGEAGAKEAGKFRVEGKTYEVKDGDVLHFLFNG